jgi:hypothetical protein
MSRRCKRMNRRRTAKRTSKRMLEKRRWNKKEIQLKNKMYELKENAVAKTGVTEEGDLENEWQERKKRKTNKDILVIFVPDLFTESRRP